MNSEDYNSRNNFFFLCPDPIWRTSFFDLNQSTAKLHNELNSISSVSVSREKLHITSNHSFSLSNFNIGVYAHSFSVFQAFVLSLVESKVKWYKILFIDFDAKFSISWLSAFIYAGFIIRQLDCVNRFLPDLKSY